ncbi:MAG: AsmA-like C-terminal region-containing protein [Lentimicrobium sp.]|jgi:cell division septum initiation protein DivIVA|nr:AsmA-like C-terminal region-containing protein [Lentimicrobium sp.]
MKKFLKILTVVVLAILLAMVALPFVFKGKIVEAIKKEANKSLNAKLDFDGVSLSLFRDFPNLSVGLKDLSVVGIDDFKQDTLAYIHDLNFTLNLRSVINGDSYEIKKVSLEEPYFKFKVLADGRANWDIMKPSADTVVSVEEAPSAPFRAALKSMNVTDGTLIYEDATLPMLMLLQGTELDLSGDLTADYTELMTALTAKSITVDYDGIRYMNNSTGSLNAKIGADLVAWKFSFPDAKLTVNDLALTAQGFFAMPDVGYDMDIRFEAPQNTFKNFLSLVPAIYSKDFASVQTNGNLALSGFVKGLYSETTMPAFGVNIKVDNAMFRYPDLPQAVENISLIANISSANGQPDATIIDLQKFHLEIAGNPIDARLYVSTPVSDPNIDAKVVGKLKLSDVNKFYPLEAGDELAGMLDADFAAKGRLSVIESGNYEAFEASGFLVASDVRYKTAALPDGISISEAKLNLTPAFVEMPVLKAVIGKNDIAASGKIENMLAYAFDKGILRGQLSMSSSYFNLNDLMTESPSTASSSDTSSMGVIEVPDNIDFTLLAAFEQVIYDNMDLRNVKGTLRINDKKVMLDNLSMNTLDGTLLVDGTYSAQNPEKPDVDFSINIVDMDVKKVFQTFNTMEKLAPIAGAASGKISTQFKIKTNLDGQMMPVYSSINGGGKLMSPSLTFTNVNSMQKIGDALKIDKLKQWAVEKINLSFEMVDGKVFVKPFETAVGKIKADISGWNSFDQTMQYVMQLNIPRSEFGGAANNVLNNLVNEANKKGANFSLGDVVPVSVLIGGTITNPTISTDLKSTVNNVVEDMKTQIKETIQEKKEEAVAKVREEASKYIEEANAKAQKLLADAQKQADEVMRVANESATKLVTEADKKAEQLIAEGKKKGPIAEMAAKKAAETVKKEAATSASRLTAEAQKTSDGIMTKARLESDKIVQDARDKADGK